MKKTIAAIIRNLSNRGDEKRKDGNFQNNLNPKEKVRELNPHQRGATTNMAGERSKGVGFYLMGILKKVGLMRKCV